MAGKVLPALKPDDDQDEAEDRNINKLIDDCLKDMTYDGFPIYSMPVPCIGNEVVIDSQEYNTQHCSQEDVTVIQRIFDKKKYIFKIK